ncbi:MAG: hypothetical protein HYW78_03690 [Parcubacteria group bacterium]|nr:hypothetical protein [Parcubacteria group bacterium]
MYKKYIKKQSPLFLSFLSLFLFSCASQPHYLYSPWKMNDFDKLRVEKVQLITQELLPAVIHRIDSLKYEEKQQKALYDSLTIEIHRNGGAIEALSKIENYNVAPLLLEAQKNRDITMSFRDETAKKYNAIVVSSVTFEIKKISLELDRDLFMIMMYTEENYKQLKNYPVKDMTATK